MVTWQEIIQCYHVKYYNQISKVTKPASDLLDIACVNYLKICNDARFVYLTNLPECVEYYVSEQVYRCDPYFKHPDFFKPGFSWEENSSSENYKKCLFKINNKFNLYSPLVLIGKGINYVEMFSFFGSSSEAIQTLHLKYPHLLKVFAEHYKRELNPLLNKMEEEGFSLIDLQGESFYTDSPDSSIKTESIYAFLIALGKKAEVERASSLSSRERDCLRLLLRGNSAKDTATELNLSPRTVEFYLGNVKNKLNCNGKRELCSIGREFENLGLL